MTDPLVPLKVAASFRRFEKSNYLTWGMTVMAMDSAFAPSNDLLCFSHLRWDWVYQRPQHLMSRAARERRVFYVEEPVRSDDGVRIEEVVVAPNITVVRPHIPHGVGEQEVALLQRELLDDWLAAGDVRPHTLWYYTPMSLPFTSHLRASLVVYDCMDELSNFAGAPAALQLLERQLLAACDLVFTGGQSLYEAKAPLHHNCHVFPSSVDAAHFAKARTSQLDPESQRHIPRPRLGYCGVIDERIDLPLMAALADARPDWHQIFIGPITKIDPATLPVRANIHFLGARPYSELPSYFAGWDVGLLPFALNESTRFISPTKTPEYLAAGLRVVSTPVRDVVRTWGAGGFVRVAAGVHTFESAVQASLDDADVTHVARVDRVLAQQSWDLTWNRMNNVMADISECAA